MEPKIAERPRAFIRAAGPDAASYLQRMVSNDVEALGVGGSCEALLLTAKGRVIATMRILRRGEEDFLLLTEPEVAEQLLAELQRMRFAAKVEVEPEEHRAYLLLGDVNGGVPNGDYGIPAGEILDGDRPALPELSEEELETLRIEAGKPRFGREIDESILPAEAGLDETHISFTKGCFPGQEPVARLHYRGHPNRRLRVLEVEAAEPGVELVWEGKVVGRVTSAVPGLALGFVRNDVPDDAALELAGAEGHARMRPA
jgi:tRNA-modifying protein YgfZ